MPVIIGGAGGASVASVEGPSRWAIDPVAHGAKGDTVTVTDAAMAAASANLASVAAGFTSAHVGKTCIVHGAGPNALAAPTLSLGSATSGGFFTAGTYFWKVTALNKNGETIGSNEVTATVTSGQQQALTWAAVTGAIGYVLYRGVAVGAENTVVGYLGVTTSFTDIGGNSGFLFSPPTVNTTGDTLVATISGYTSPTQVTLSAAASTAVTGAEASFGTDDTAALNNALSAAIDANNLFSDRRYGTEWTRGGDRVLIPPGSYITTSQITVPPRVTVDAYGATLVAAHTGSVIGFSTGGAFGGRNVRIRGLDIDGSSLAAIGLDLGLQSFSAFRDMLIYRNDTGLKVRGGEWDKFESITTMRNATVGFDIDKDAPSNVQASDITFDQCVAQSSFAAGFALGTATNILFTGCSAQLAGMGGAGYLIKAGAFSTMIVGGHLEQNGIHVDIQAGAKGTTIVGPMGVLTCYRYVRNSGTSTQVYGMSAYTNLPSLKLNGSSAAIEQSTTSGDVTFYGQNTLTTGKLFCDETGAEYDPDTAAVPARMTWVHKDLRQSAETFWQPATYKSAANATAIQALLGSDNFSRFALTTNGNLVWGPGNAAGDNVLLRIAAGLMMLTSTLIPDAANTRDLGSPSQPWRSLFVGNAASSPFITGGAGIPAVAAPVGSLYLRYDGGAGTTLYVKESGTGSSGWVAK